MSEGELICQNNGRRSAIHKANESGEDWNGIDYVKLECLEKDWLEYDFSYRYLLHVYFFCPLPSLVDLNILNDCLRVKNQRDERLQDETWKVVAFTDNTRISVGLNDVGLENIQKGQWTITFCCSPSAASQLDWHCDIDQRLNSVQFRYHRCQPQLKVDPKPASECDAPRGPEPEVDYTARDYRSYLRLIHDRLALTIPQWRETHVPDIGVAITEIMAYVADQLSYFQDAVATESYLYTARNRISVRRHAKLVNYAVDEGSNARTMIHARVANDALISPDDLYFINRPSQAQAFEPVNLAETVLQDTPRAEYHVFEPIADCPCPSPEFSLADLNDPLQVVYKVRFFSQLDQSDFQAIFSYLRSMLEDLVDDVANHWGQAWQSEDSLRVKLQHSLNQIVRSTTRLDRSIDRSNLSTRAQQLLADCDPKREWDRINRIVLDDLFCDELIPQQPEAKLQLYREHNQIEIYTWDQSECCLPRGATSITLKDRWLQPCEPGYAERVTLAHCADDQQSPIDPVPQPTDTADCNSCDDEIGRPRALRLTPGDLLLLEEIVDPSTGLALDANPEHRQIVRIVNVRKSIDRLHGVPVLEVSWHQDDALTFPLCISAVSAAPSCQLNVASVARGNIIPVDHGESIVDEPIAPVEGISSTVDCDQEHITNPQPQQVKRFRPMLERTALTFGCLPKRNDSVHAWLSETCQESLPQIKLLGIPSHPQTGDLLFTPQDLRNADECGSCIPYLDGPAATRLQNAISPALGQDFVFLQSLVARGADRRVRRLAAVFCRRLLNDLAWLPSGDLFERGRDARSFVVEMDNERRAHLRFGGGLGRPPSPGTRFFATYRVGGGAQANIGADSLTRVVHRRGFHTVIEQVTNPIAAVGGRDPESLDHIKTSAPISLQDLDRAITAEDYVQLITERLSDLVSAARCRIERIGIATLVFITLDPQPNHQQSEVDTKVEQMLQTVRRAGHWIVLLTPQMVAVTIKLNVLIRSGHSQSLIRRQLQDRLGAEAHPDGSMGLFHPQRHSFGATMHSSQVVAEAMQVPGVQDVVVCLCRGTDPCEPTETATQLEFADDEIPVLASDRDDDAGVVVTFVGEI